MAHRIGVFGAAFTWLPESEIFAANVGRRIVERGCVVVTGGTSGLPHIAGCAALNGGGQVIGISPAKNATEHVDVYKKPISGVTHMIWTGAGFTGRNYLNLRNCDGAIFIGGELGTLEEFCVGCYEGKVLGVLENSGGVCGILRQVLGVCRTDHGYSVTFSTEPNTLVDTIVRQLDQLLIDQQKDSKTRGIV